ncbi:conserved membrane protein of unknown function [Rhodovastum atsumiense]|uniref:Uncharacterized protein n=1 Tax=Rhodovastum atsumiense TaxID=504468 RepID=A0A5M6INZ3_9PROT|nr:hypothetical protein [Rhodovastum atsumiense]KAA5609185.1 hypothetical protein F1189_25475 [Rhodovastum atsumiense]CAH2602814.1 conserved membrane protein of unknown function [Rhodovastum atsumiense]
MLRRLVTGIALFSIPSLAFAQVEPATPLGQNLLLTLSIWFIAGVVATTWLLVGLLGRIPVPFPAARQVLEPNLAWAVVGVILASLVWSGWEFHGAVDFVVAVAGGVVVLELGRLIGQVRFPGVPDWQAR